VRKTSRGAKRREGTTEKTRRMNETGHTGLRGGGGGAGCLVKSRRRDISRSGSATLGGAQVEGNSIITRESCPSVVSHKERKQGEGGVATLGKWEEKNESAKVSLLCIITTPGERNEGGF